MSETTGASGEQDIRPLVARAVNNRGVWLFGGLLAASALGLFWGLEARRGVITSPATTPGLDSMQGVIAPPPALAIPGDGFGGDGFAPYAELAQPPPRALLAVPRAAPSQPRSAPQSPYVPPAAPQAYAGPIAFPPIAGPSGPAVVYRASGPRVGAEAGAAPGGDAKLAGERAHAGTFANPATTVPQGSVIQAVLETALDSTRPGFARAIISRDVRGFDGSRVLIPRGSRLYGEYKADLAAGQNRALIQWQRLMRPDGVIITIDSPAGDPLGRAGVKGSVNSHFFERFSSAILQSALDVGVGLATRSVSNGTVVVALPGSTQDIVRAQPQSVRPTLKVRQGASVSVFVARDLDFTAVEP